MQNDNHGVAELIIDSIKGEIGFTFKLRGSSVSMITYNVIKKISKKIAMVML